jgi:hypothetical protein
VGYGLQEMKKGNKGYESGAHRVKGAKGEVLQGFRVKGSKGYKWFKD